MGVISLPLPRPVEALHQIEIESRCNLRCVYCTSPNLARPKQSMPREVFVRSLEHVKHYVAQKTQVELNLCGIGESLLHPEFTDFLRLAREAVPNTFINFTTNGLLFTEELAKVMADLNVYCFISNHRPEKSGPARNIAKRYGVFLASSNDPAENAINWAGQVDWEVTAQPGRECPWIRGGRAMVRADGLVTRCCYDAGRSPDAVLGNVNDPLGSFMTSPYSLCRACEQEIHVSGFDQRAPLPQTGGQA